VCESPQSPARRGPETARFYSAVVDRLLSQDGSPALARHVADAVLKEDSRGARLAKEHKDKTADRRRRGRRDGPRPRRHPGRRPRAEHLRLMGYPRMSKRPRDPSYTEAVRLLSAIIRALGHSQALPGLGGRARFHRRPHSQTGEPKKASPV
jgi:hypothetical protein